MPPRIDKKGKVAKSTKRTPSKPIRVSATLQEMWFDVLFPDTETITFDQYRKWLLKMGIDPDSAIPDLVLFLFNVPSPEDGAEFSISRKLWISWMAENNAYCKDDFLNALHQHVAKYKPKPNSWDFVAFWKWIFIFNTQGGGSGQRTVDLDTVINYIELVFDPNNYSIGLKEKAVYQFPTFLHRKYFVDFLKTERPVRAFSRDMWSQWERFASNVGFSLKNYDSNTSSYPILLDQYVAWRKENIPELDEDDDIMVMDG